MKACVWGEMSAKLKGSGIGRAQEQQCTALQMNGVATTRDANDTFDVIDINTIFLRSLYTAKRMRRRGKPVVIHSHTTAEDTKDSFRLTTTIAPLLKMYLTYFYSQADLIISPTEYTKNILRTYGIKNRIIPISNGIDTQIFRPDEHARERGRAAYGLEGTVVYSVGHVFRRKGILDFFEIARKFPDTAFAWAGLYHPKLVESEVNNAVEHKPKNLKLVGFVPDIKWLHCGGDIFLFPSYCENQGIVILEAAACMKPVIVRDIPVYDDWLHHGENCLKAKTNEEFARHVQTLMDDKRLAEKLAKNAHDMAQGHDLKIVGGELKRAYESVITNDDICSLKGQPMNSPDTAEYQHIKNRPL